MLAAACLGLEAQLLPSMAPRGLSSLRLRPAQPGSVCLPPAVAPPRGLERGEGRGRREGSRSHLGKGVRPGPNLGPEPRCSVRAGSGRVCDRGHLLGKYHTLVGGWPAAPARTAVPGCRSPPPPAVGLNQQTGWRAPSHLTFIPCASDGLDGGAFQSGRPDDCDHPLQRSIETPPSGAKAPQNVCSGCPCLRGRTSDPDGANQRLCRGR